MQPKIDEDQFDGRWHNNDSGGIGPPLYASPGLYAIYSDDVLIYIGQSANVQRRVCRHCEKMNADWDDGWFVEWIAQTFVSKSDIWPIHYKWAYEPNTRKRVQREAALIKRLRPVSNIQHTGGE